MRRITARIGDRGTVVQYYSTFWQTIVFASDGELTPIYPTSTIVSLEHHIGFHFHFVIFVEVTDDSPRALSHGTAHTVMKIGVLYCNLSLIHI